MDCSIRTGTPLRQRMIEDMRMRKLEHKTQEAYIRAVCKLAAFLRRSPDTAIVEDLRRFQCVRSSSHSAGSAVLCPALRSYRFWSHASARIRHRSTTVGHPSDIVGQPDG